MRIVMQLLSAQSLLRIFAKLKQVFQKQWQTEQPYNDVLYIILAGQITQQYHAMYII